MTSETTLREYVVTLHKFDDLESFYTDMETEGGDLYIPNREVDIALRRPISRNTHYMLSDQEAEQLRQDPRVLAVELTLEEQGLKIEPAWTQTSNRWSKLETVALTEPYPVTSGQYNWGLLRVASGQHIPNWGSPKPTWLFGVTNPTGIPEVSGTVTVPFSGKNVDVVILDGMLEAAHPEFAKNPDGTGGSRVVPYNWYQHNSTVGAPPGTLAEYPYTPADPYSDYHGTHVAGTVAGNSQGWARDANIYNLYIYGRAPLTPSSLQFDYIRAWHNSKPINPATGRKNPTIVNCSWIVNNGIGALIDWIKSIRYRGTVYSGPFTEAQLISYGIPYLGSTASAPNRNAALEQDIAQCIADGIIVVAAAGNDSFKVNLPNDDVADDYNNYFYWEFTATNGSTLTQTKFYNRGPTPAAAPDVISVGAIGNYAGSQVNFLDEKAPYSNCGPRIDIFSPGSAITSAVNNNWKNQGVTPDQDTDPVTAADPRNSLYRTVSINGTSMASPQVTGVLATLLEVSPSLTQAQARSYIINNAKTAQLYSPSTTNLYGYGLQGAANRTLFAKYPATISITASTTTATPLQPVIYTITLTDVADGSLVYLTDLGTSLSTDFNDGVRQFVLTVNGGTASLTRTVSAGITGTRTSILQLRTGGYDGNIQSTASTVTVSLGDFADNSGSFTVNSQGIGSFSITPRLDSAIEGAETFTISIRTGSVSGDVVKTSDSITINAST